MTTLSYDELHDELWRVEEAFIRILGKKPLYVCLSTSPLMLSNLFASQSPPRSRSQS
jgi:beta-galactosidase GanA